MRRWTATVGIVVGALLVVAGVQVLVRPQVVEARPFGLVAQEVAPAGPTVLVEGESAADELPLVVAVARPSPVPPEELSFPSVGTVAPVVPVGVLPSGALQLPDDPATVGWWAAGAMPGQAGGTVVLAGHMDGLRRAGAMSAVLELGQGDVVAVTDGRGSAHEYRVVARSTAPWEDLDPGLFSVGGAHRLLLITCGGTFDDRLGRYTDNIVVVADPVD